MESNTVIFEQSCIDLLESTNQYKIIRAVKSPDYHPNENRSVVCVLLDCEATSRDNQTALPVELGMLKVAFNPFDLTSIVAIDHLSMLNDPGVPSEPGAEAVHGITQEQLIGKKFDLDQIDIFLKDVDFLVAHNAAYDRPVLSRVIPALNSMRWLCSMKEVDWAGLGISSRALDYITYKAGYFYQGHRAIADCEALLTVLSHPYLGGAAPFFILDEKKSLESTIILCNGAPFETKDLMKQRGYRWNAGDNENDIPVKCWSTPEIVDQEKLLIEMKWLAENIYNHRNVDLTMIKMNSLFKYRLDDRQTAYKNKAKFNLNNEINMLTFV